MLMWRVVFCFGQRSDSEPGVLKLKQFLDAMDEMRLPSFMLEDLIQV